MSGPSLKRGGQKSKDFEQKFGTGSFQAPFPQLTGQSVDLLRTILQNPQQYLSQALPTSSLQQQTGNTFSQLLSGAAPFNQTNNALMQQLGLTGVPGGNVIAAAQPIFQRNLQDAADIQRQAGPRFASATGQQIAQQQGRALQDFNLFQQNVMESALGRQLQAAMGAGSFGNQQQAMQMQFLLPLLQAGLTAGGANTQPAIYQDQGFAGNVLSPLLQAGAVASMFIPGGQVAAPFLAAGSQMANSQVPDFGTFGANRFRGRP